METMSSLAKRKIIKFKIVPGIGIYRRKTNVRFGD